jgi:hypothetical protein
MKHREKVELELLDHQFETLTCDDPFPFMIGGIGSGKSFTGAAHVLQMAKLNPFATGFIGANSYKQLHDATLQTTFSFLDSNRIPFTYKQGKGHLWVGPKLFLCRTLENYDDFRGFEIGDYWVDEACYAKEIAIKTLMGRLRHNKSKFFKGLHTSSPAGFNWAYEWLVTNPKTGFKMIRAKTKDNTHLPQGYEQMLASTYDARMIAQELEGDFVNLNALPTYYAWDRKLIDPALEFRSFLPIYIGMDFNVNPMTAVIFQIDSDGIYFLDEVWLEGEHGNTYKMADKLNELGYRGCSVIPDATGKALKTSAVHGMSDHVILKQKGFNVISNASNPHVADRFLCVNGLMNKARLKVHPRCIKLIRDFEQHTRNGEHEDYISHISDAAGYGCWKFFPITSQRPTVRQYNY